MPAGSAAAVTAGTATWAAAGDIHFFLVGDGGGPWNAPGAPGLVGDIRIGSGDIGADGEGPTLAHAYTPPPNGVSAAGDLHFDGPQPWSVVMPPPPGTFDVQTVAVHELGHSLGLDHLGTVAADVMFGAHTGVKRALSPGDIAFIVAIYGAAPHAAECGGVPTLSEWGMVALALLLLTAVTLTIRREQVAAKAA
jgi:hypothetical protein